jgi:hypothetical protein
MFKTLWTKTKAAASRINPTMIEVASLLLTLLLGACSLGGKRE